MDTGSTLATPTANKTDQTKLWRQWGDGFIEQWMYIGGPTSGRITVTFPKAFPNKCHGVLLSQQCASRDDHGLDLGPGINTYNGTTQGNIATTGFECTCESNRVVWLYAWGY